MTIKELGYSIIDNSKTKDRRVFYKYTLIKNINKDNAGGYHSLYSLYKSVLLRNMSDDKHLAYMDALNPFRVRMTHFLNKLDLNEEQRDLIEARIFYDVYLKDIKMVHTRYGKKLSKLKCVKQFNEYRENMIKNMDVHPYLLK